jgi:adenosine kinase
VLSVSFTVGEMRREWGGCAGNIAYNLRGLGGEPVVMATIGDDGLVYRDRLNTLGVDTEGVRHIEGAFTAQAFIITDLDDNQITAFHPGAMTRSHENEVGRIAGVGWGIVAPDGRDGMLKHAAGFRAAGVPYIFDPGQGMTLFAGDELLTMIDGAAVVTVNDYEGRLLCERTGQTLDELASMVDALVVTMGGEGSVIHFDGGSMLIPAANAAAIIDPTGCGDAYRAGLLYGLSRDWDWQRIGQLASTMGAIKISSRGGQNHGVNRERVASLYAASYGSSPW